MMFYSSKYVETKQNYFAAVLTSNVPFNMASYNVNNRIQLIITTSIIDARNIVRMLHEYNRIPDARLAVLLAS